MKKLFSKIFLVLLLPFLSMIGYSSWVIVVDKTNEVNINENTTPVNVCYITTSIDLNTKLGEYTSIERALQVAKNGEIVHVYLNSAVSAKTIKNDCVIKEGVTLNIPYSEEEGKLFISENTNGVVVAIHQAGSLSTDSCLKNTLIINDGVTIYNYGTIIVSGELSGGSGGSAYTGQTYNAFSKIIMGSKSKIKSYGEIISCGYIEEKENNNGSIIEIFEGALKMPFVVRDFKGGMDTLAIYNSMKEKSIIFFNQFEIINVKPKISVKYGGALKGYANIYIRSNNDAIVNLIGNDSNYFIQIQENWYIDIKYNKDTSVANYEFYGGCTFNRLTMNLNFALTDTIKLPIDLDTTNVFFPLTWRMNITLNKYPGQNGIAEFNSQNQRLKLMPGHKLVVNKGCKLIVPDTIVYSYFSDERNVDSPIAGAKYDSSESAKLIVKGQFECTGKFGGRIIYDDNLNLSTDIKLKETSINVYEPLNTKPAKLMLVVDIEAVNDLTLISETTTYIPYSKYMNENEFIIGVYRTMNGAQPTYTLNSSSGEFNKNSCSTNLAISFPTNERVEVDLLTNVSIANWNNAYYVKKENKIINEAVLLDISSSTNAIGNVSMGTITIEGGNTIKVGDSIQYSVSKTNANSYTKTYRWVSSNESVATVKDGLVKGISEGTTNIYAEANDYSNEKSNVITLTVKSLEEEIPISNVSISAEPETGKGAYTSKISIANIYPEGVNEDTYNVLWNIEDDETTGTEIVSGTNTKSSVQVSVPNNEKETSVTVKVRIKIIDINDSSNVLATSTVTLTAQANPPSSGGGGCLLPDTLITIADGSKVPVKDIKPGDMLKVFNHETGLYDVAPVLFNDSEKEELYNVINLEFSNGSNVGVVYEHGFFDLDEMKYVYIDEYNYNDYIGHRFYIDGGIEAILNRATVTQKYTRIYSPVTRYHMNYFTEDVLSMPGGVSGLFNIFEYDDNLQYNQEQMQKDIEMYGLFTYEDFEGLVPYELYDSFATPYFKVAIGKGILTWEQLYYYIERYGPLVE